MGAPPGSGPLQPSDRACALGPLETVCHLPGLGPSWRVSHGVRALGANTTCVCSSAPLLRVCAGLPLTHLPMALTPPGPHLCSDAQCGAEARGHAGQRAGGQGSSLSHWEMDGVSPAWGSRPAAPEPGSEASYPRVGTTPRLPPPSPRPPPGCQAGISLPAALFSPCHVDRHSRVPDRRKYRPLVWTQQL